MKDVVQEGTDLAKDVINLQSDLGHLSKNYLVKTAVKTVVKEAASDDNQPNSNSSQNK